MNSFLEIDLFIKLKKIHLIKDKFKKKKNRIFFINFVCSNVSLFARKMFAMFCKFAKYAEVGIVCVYIFSILFIYEISRNAKIN